MSLAKVEFKSNICVQTTPVGYGLVRDFIYTKLHQVYFYSFGSLYATWKPQATAKYNFYFMLFFYMQ